MSIVIDTIKSPPVDAMRGAGVTGVSRYLSWADARDTLGKVIHKPEYDQLVAAGFDVMLNWEFDAQDYVGGAMRGATHAQESIRQARALGYPDGCAIYGSADHDVSRADWLGTGRPYYLAFSSGLRVAGYRAGIYGPWDVLTWARDDNAADVFWQAGMSTAWSAGRNAQLWPGAHLRQRHQQTIGGQDCDVNDIVQADYGQYRGGTDVELIDKTHLLKVDPATGNLVPGPEVTVERLLQLTQVQASQAAVLLSDANIAKLATALAAHPAPGTGTDPAAIGQALRDVLPTIRLSAG